MSPDRGVPADAATPLIAGHPHCHWTVTIDESFPPVAPHPHVALVERSRAARATVDDPGASWDGMEPGGWDDYSGPFDPDFALEDLSHRALVVALQEIAIQSDLLLRGFALAVASRDGADAPAPLIAQMVVGLGGITAQRLVPAMNIGADANGIANLLQIHPLFWPRSYVHPSIELVDGRVRFALLDDSPMFAEGEHYTWLASLPGEADRAIDAIVQAVDRRARSERVDARAGERCAYEAFVDVGAPPAVDPPEVSLAKISTGASFEFVPRRPVRV